MKRLLPAVLVVLLLAGCGVGAESEPRALDVSGLPAALTSPQPPAEETGDSKVNVYFVREGRLQAVSRTVSMAPTVIQLLDTLNRGPSAEESAAGLTTSVPSGAKASVAVLGGIATVTLTGDPSQTRLDEPLGFGQIVLTLNDSPLVTGVSFQRDGRPLNVPRADGEIATGPVTSADYQSLLR